MTIFPILAPYAAFTLLMLVSSPLPSLLAAAAICGIVIGYDVLGGRSIKLLGASSAILFTSLGGYLILSRPEPFGDEAGGRLRPVCDRAAVAGDPLSLHAAICPRGGRCPNRRSAGLFDRKLYHHSGVDGRFSVDVDGQRADDLSAGPAALVGIGDCVRRPQHRALFYQLVSAIPAREIRRSCMVKLIICVCLVYSKLL